MEAKIIGPASELGPFETLKFFGQPIGREWTKIDMTADQLRKLEGNRFVEIKGASSDKASDEEVEEGLIRKRLIELGVLPSNKASLKTLQSTLEKAEAAKAAQDAEEAETLAEAERIQAAHAQ